MVIALPPFPFCRFWKRAGFVPVYLRQTPVSEAWGRGRAGFVSTVGTERSSLPGCALGGVSAFGGVPLWDRQLSSFQRQLSQSDSSMAPSRSAASLALCFIIQWSGYTWACWPGYRVSLQAGVSPSL